MTSVDEYQIEVESKWAGTTDKFTGRAVSDDGVDASPARAETLTERRTAAPHNASSTDETFEILHLAPLSRMLRETDDRRAFVNGAGKSMVMQALAELVRSKGTAVLSYDVFDTLLLRNDKPEAVRYLEMSARMLSDLRSALGADALRGLAPEDLMLARAQGMKASYAFRPLVRGCGEGRIEDVVTVVCEMLGLPPEAADILIASEIDHEIANLTLNEALYEFAVEFTQQGKRVILVSDMYLGAAHIRRIVEGALPKGAWPFAELASSADLVISKRSGLIFPELAGRLDAEPEEFLHVGDSFVGDVRQPRANGWAALHFPISVAEMSRRRAALAQFVCDMAAADYDVGSWAKV